MKNVKQGEEGKKILSKKEIFEKIKESQERLIVSLAAAWESAPDDPEIRKQLIEASKKAVNLREKVYKNILKEEPPDVRDSYEKLRAKIEQ